jgi:hypothetical protein
MTPIPRYLLPHYADVVRKTTSDGWGGGDTETITLRWIRIIPAHSQAFSLNGDIPQVSAKMFYDCKNSLPENMEFKTGDIIRFMGRDYAVQKVETHFEDGAEPHHLEVILA